MNNIEIINNYNEHTVTLKRSPLSIKVQVELHDMMMALHQHTYLNTLADHLIRDYGTYAKQQNPPILDLNGRLQLSNDGRNYVQAIEEKLLVSIVNEYKKYNLTSKFVGFWGSILAEEVNV